MIDYGILTYGFSILSSLSSLYVHVFLSGFNTQNPFVPSVFAFGIFSSQLSMLYMEKCVFYMEKSFKKNAD